MADKRDIIVNLLGKETVSAAAGKAGKGLDKLGDSFDSTADDAKRLDGEIGGVEQSLKTLAMQYARTSDAAERTDISKAMRKQHAELRKLTSARNFLGDGDEAASGFGASIVTKLGPILARAPLSPPLLAAAGAAAPGIAGIIAGAVVGGVGIGGVVGGMAIASKHADVQKAGTQLGDTLKTVLQRSAISFVPATVGALGDVRSEILSMEDDFEHVFASASRYVKPLTAGVTGFAKNLMPGVKDAVDQAGPIIDEVSSWGPRLGTTLSNIFSDFSDNAAEGSRALGTFFTVADYGLKTVGFLGNALTETYGFIDRGTAMLTGNTAAMAKYAAEEIRAREGGDDFAAGLENLLNKLGGYGEKVETAAQKNERLLASFNGLTNAAASSRAATMDFEAGLDELTASVQRNGTTMDVGSAKGRANRQVIEGLIGAADRAGQAAENRALAEGASAEVAAAAGAKMRSTYIRDLEAAARKANLSKSAVAAMVAEIKRADGLRARMIVETIFKQTGKPGTEFGGIGGQHYKGYASGGPINLRGPKGVDSGLIAAAPGEHMLTADEVDAAGGHSAIKQWRESLLRPRGGSSGGAPAAGGGGGGGVHRTVHVLQWPNGQVAAEIVCEGFSAGGGRVLGAVQQTIKNAGGNPRALGIGGSWSR